MKFRVEDADAKPEGRFKDTHTSYQGRKIKLPVFYIGRERFALSLSNAQQAVVSVDAAKAVLSRCVDMLDDTVDRSGIEDAALLLQEQCRKLMGWKEKPKRDKPPRRARSYYL